MNKQRTNIYILNPEIWAWARYRAKTLGYKNISEYIYSLIKKDREAQQP